MGYIKQPDAQYTQEGGRGNWGQRFKAKYGKRQTWPGWAFGGTGIVQGYIKIASTGATNCRAVLLSEATGALLDEASITDGAYLFQRLAPGNYVVLVIDMSGQLRSKAIHTVVPTP